MTKPHDCAQQGHVWIEPDGTLYTRHRDRTGTIDGTCVHCGATATLDAHGNSTAPPKGDAQKEALVELMQDETVAERVAVIRTTGPSIVS